MKRPKDEQISHKDGCLFVHTTRSAVPSTTFCGNIPLTYKCGVPILTSNKSKFLSKKVKLPKIGGLMLVRRVSVCFITIIFSLFINFIFIDTGHADPLTISGSSQMSTGGTQTFTATGGTGPYTWGIAGGGGSIDSSTGAYTAPTSNANCENNATVCVTDSTGQKSCMGIAINAASGTTTVAIYAYPVQISYNPYAGQTCDCGWRVDFVQYNCAGNLSGTPAGVVKMCGTWTSVTGNICSTCDCCTGCPTRYKYDPPGCWGNWKMDYSSPSMSAALAVSKCEAAPCKANINNVIYNLNCNGVTDGRTDTQKAAGCCPAQLLSGSSSSETNSKGNTTCPITIGSTANFRSGNLYHDQEAGKLTLSYNSIDTYDGPLGKKWTHNYDLKLTILSGNATLILKTEDGNVIYFRLSGGIYYPEAISGDTSRIVKNANNTYTRTLKNGTTQAFGTTGLLTSITDRNSKIITLTYSGSSLASIIDQNNRTTTITTTSGKITGITDALGRTHTLTYTNGLLTAVTDPLSNAWHYTYDTAGRMLTKVDPLNNTITYTYDTNGKLLTSTDPQSKTRTMTYTQPGTTTFTEKDGGAWTYTYDPVYTVKTSQTDPLNNITQYKYDLKRNLTAVIYPDSSTTTYTYDAAGNMLTQTDPLGKTTTYTYNSLNLITGITDPKSNITQYGYDSLGNLTSITDAENFVTQYQYDSRGNITSITNPLNKTTTMTYDSHNNLLTVTDPKSGTVTMTYDSVGNMLTQTDPLSKVTTFLYNNLNQLTQVTDPKGYITQYTYDYKGNRLSTADGNNNATWFTYDYKGQMKTITDALSNVTTMAYGTTGCSSCAGVDKLTALTDAKNHTTAYEYDLRGKLTKETDPLNKITTYTYDNKGNLITRTSPDNRTITYSYDLNNRLTQKLYSNSTVAAFQYDDAGNMTYAGNANIAYNFTYNADNRITNIIDSNNRSITYTYDAAGNRATMVTPDSRTLTYSYDNNNLPSQIATTLGNFTFTYDAVNRRTTLTAPNGTTSTYTYDDDSRLTSITTTNGGTAIDSTTYTLDGVGNRLTKSQPQQSISNTYTYDTIYRLTQATPTGGSYPTEAFTYDNVGNRLTKTNEETPNNSETTTYSYDDENRLTAVQITGNNLTRQIAFAYDPFGRRIKKTVSPSGGGVGEETTYVYDNQNIILEYDSSNNIQIRYTHGINIDEPLAMEKNSQVYYYHADGLGSITALSNASGSIVQRYEYDSFGNMTITTNGSISQPYTYTAREYDTETGMYFYRARYYDPKAGRFVTKDPISFAGGDVNLYAYVGNNPGNRIDPLGLYDDDPFPPNPYNPGTWPWPDSKCITCDDGLVKCLLEIPKPNTIADCLVCSEALSKASNGKDVARILATNPACIRCGGNLALNKAECFSKHFKTGIRDKCGNCKTL
jgi:RHS repeat-associated protein